MDFEQVFPMLKAGQMVSRTSWPKGEFVFMQVPSCIPNSVVPKMQSLPQPVKDEFIRRGEDPELQVSDIYYSNQLARVNISNLIVGYNPSTSDILATDWISD